MYQTSNFTPLQTKKNLESKEKQVIFSPKSTKVPLKSIYKKISKASVTHFSFGIAALKSLFSTFGAAFASFARTVQLCLF